MRDALRALGVQISEQGERWLVTPPPAYAGGGRIDCGLAGTVMRFVPPLAALADGPVEFVGDEQAQTRPMAAILDGLRGLGAEVAGDALPFTVTGRPDLP